MNKFVALTALVLMVYTMAPTAETHPIQPLQIVAKLGSTLLPPNPDDKRYENFNKLTPALRDALGAATSPLDYLTNSVVPGAGQAVASLGDKN